MLNVAFTCGSLSSDRTNVASACSHAPLASAVCRTVARGRCWRGSSMPREVLRCTSIMTYHMVLEDGSPLTLALASSASPPYLPRHAAARKTYRTPVVLDARSLSVSWTYRRRVFHLLRRFSLATLVGPESEFERTSSLLVVHRADMSTTGNPNMNQVTSRELRDNSVR